MNSKKMARKFEKHYASHNAVVKLELLELIGNGERLIFDVKISKGTKESLVFNRASDIRTALELPLFQPFKEGVHIRLAVSERPVTENSLWKMLKSPVFHTRGIWIPIGLGYDLRGKMCFDDLAKFPHALYGGATNSGKTVGLRNLLVSIAVKRSVERVNLIIVDTGASGLDLFDPLPHLSCPIVKDEKTAVRVLFSLIREMERRITLTKDELRLLPAIVCVVDEYISLISKIGDGEKYLISAISNLLRRGRHAKIHMVLATQECAKQDMLINRTNLNARMAFACSDFYSSRNILGESGAENLTGKGAMLFKSPRLRNSVYLQGAYMSTEEIGQLIASITSAVHDFSNKFVVPEVDLLQSQPPQNQVWTSENMDNKTSKLNSDKELAGIIIWALGRKTVSALQIKKQFQMDKRADAMVDELFKMNLISEKYSNQPRKVLPTCYDDLSAEVVSFINHHGYSEEQIREAFYTK